ncbi:hypothetical protein [Pyxidicoccus xibeiensis]|uniref:hypothetical protein n=1 Tax=Pyxidicoccus xibeiensis TaxID=2906759 RepID=UPI0020A71298|nr:hypothetical protein [Pyxidicoccus xibeiensis]MCP3139161.1 hypothetical protein [Pyxidicoccus xibeiensis]
MKTWRIFGLVGLMLLAWSCGDDGDGTQNPDSGTPGQQDRPGLGSSDKPPEGQRFTLPTGVELAGPIKGYSAFEPDKCFPAEEPKGAGALVRVCLPLRNTTNTTGNPLPISITLPPGFTVISDNLSTQNGIILQRQTVVVTPGQTIYLPLYLFCLNENRDPSSTAATFQLGPTIQYTDFQELYRLLEQKTLDPEEQYAELQTAVWRLSEGESLTSGDRNFISNL